jgi:hypothetical protein
MTECALEVAKNALDGHKVLLTRIMHVKAHLLNDVGDVGSLKVRYPNETPISIGSATERDTGSSDSIYPLL